MKTYVVTIRPTSPFGTPLKGDTLFGHLCWQAAMDPKPLGDPLDRLLEEYLPQTASGQGNPFLVVSSACPVIPDGKTDGFALRRPVLPAPRKILDRAARRRMINERKETKNRAWVLVHAGRPLSKALAEPQSEKDLFARLETRLQPEERRRLRANRDVRLIRGHDQYHNSINRLTGTTGEEGFAPFRTHADWFLPVESFRLAFFVGLRDGLPIDGLRELIRRIGAFGYGRDASTGAGRFEVTGIAPVDLAGFGAPKGNLLYTLAPCVPEPGAYEEGWYMPFVRFGKHGDCLATSRTPFKNPVLMADEGAVFQAKQYPERPFIGRGLSGLSGWKETVGQGYSLFIPFNAPVTGGES